MLLLGAHCLDEDEIVTVRVEGVHVDCWSACMTIMPDVYLSLLVFGDFADDDFTVIELVRHDDDYEIRITMPNAHVEEARRRLERVSDEITTKQPASIA